MWEAIALLTLIGSGKQLDSSCQFVVSPRVKLFPAQRAPKTGCNVVGVLFLNRAMAAGAMHALEWLEDARPAAPALQPEGAAAAGPMEALNLAPAAAVELQSAAADTRLTDPSLPAKGLMVHGHYIALMMAAQNPKTIEVRRDSNARKINNVYLIGSSSRGCFAYGSVDIGRSYLVDVESLKTTPWQTQTHVRPADIEAYAGDKGQLHCWPLSNPVLFATPVALSIKMGVVKWRCLTDVEAMVIRMQPPADDAARRAVIPDLLSDSPELTRPRKRARVNASTARAAAAAAAAGA